jgi:branched-chain amino acid aminotransferase
MEQHIKVWKLIEAKGEWKNLLIEESLEWNSLDEATRFLPGGAYTTFRTYQHWQGIHLEDHFLRLEETCRLSGYPVALDRSGIRACLREMLKDLVKIPEVRVRLSIDLEKDKGRIYIGAEPLSTPAAEKYQTGVDILTRSMHRNNPKAKLTHFLLETKDIRQELPANINEVVMVGEDGQMLEGLSSNFFAVSNGMLWTADKDVLSGITRLMVLEIAARLNIPLKKEGINIHDVELIEEAFITSASRLVLPVRKIEQITIGKVCPGAITTQIMAAFTETIQHSLEVI